MRLSSHDASFLYTETASGPMHGVAISVLDGPATYKDILEYYRARIHLVPRLRQKLAFVPFNFAHPKWIDDPNFKLENHIRKHDVPPGTTIQQAIDIGVELGEPLLDRSRPLWLTYVIEHVENKTIIVQMSHHAFVDGATAVAMSIVLTDSEPEPEPPAPEDPEWNPAPEPTQIELWQEAAQEQASASLAAIQTSPLTPQLTQQVTALMQRMARPIIQAPWNAGLVGPKRKLSTMTVELGAFKPIRQAFGGTINDVAITVVTEAATQYMVEQGVNTDNQIIRLMCPVNVRSPDDDPLDMDGNRVSGMFPILDASPKPLLERYQEVIAETTGIKQRQEPETLDALQHAIPETAPVAMSATLAVGTPLDPTQWAARVPSPIAPNFGIRPQQAGFNFTLTNVPGPSWTQYIAGHRLLDTFGTLMLGGNLGLGVGIGSLNGNMTFGFTADPRLMPDLDHFRDMVAANFDALSEHAKAAAAESSD